MATWRLDNHAESPVGASNIPASFILAKHWESMTVTTEKLLTADDLIHLCSQGVRGELLRGVLCETMPTGVRHGKTVVKLTVLLEGFGGPRGLGTIVASDVGFLLEQEPDTVREPDIAFISARRLPPDEDVPGFFEGPLTWRSKLPLRATVLDSFSTRPACGSASVFP